jgi:hypothetical protein
MKYTGNFHSVIHDKAYKVEIITDNSSSSPTELTLGPDPFVTNMDSGNNTIYVPVKYSSANVQVVSKNYHFDFYASKPKQNTVKLYDSSNNVLWTGYVTPNVYSADYNFETETWDVEAIDGLSVLKYFDYTVLDSSYGKDFVTFTQIIDKCMQTAGYYSRWYISDNLNIPGKGYCIDQLYVSEANFFDEDDTPMKLNEVLEEVLKFLGMSMLADGEYVYILDYDAIKDKDRAYYYYNTGSWTRHYVSFPRDSSAYTITKESYASTGSTLTLDNVYSKVTIKDSLYTVKSIIPSLFEDEDLQNAHYVDEDNQNWNWEFTHQCVFGGKESWLQSAKKRAEDDVYFYWKSRFYENKKYIHYYYDNSGNPISGPIMNGLNAESLTGVSFARYTIGQGNTIASARVDVDYDSFDNYLMIPNNHSVVTGKKRLESKDEFSKPFFISGKTKFIAKGSMILTDRYMFPNSPTSGNNTNIGYWPHTGTFTSDFDGNWWRGSTLSVSKSAMTLKIGLSVGSVTKTFDVPFYEYGTGSERLEENKKKHEIFYTEMGVQDNVEYIDNIKEKGYKLDMGISTDIVIPAKPNISIYGMDNMVNLFSLISGSSVLGCLFIKDFDIVAVDPFEGGDSAVNATDTEYTIEIDDEYVQELSPIEFKICTYDGKSLNYSAVAYQDPSTNEFHFVDELYNKALNLTKRSEQLLGYKIVNQYSTQSRKLSLNLLFEDKDRSNYLFKPWTLIRETVMGKDFVISSMSYDYVMDSVNVQLVEKK